MRRMLIVDDEESICFAMSQYFTMHDYQVDCSQNLEGVRALLAPDRYSVVIADLRLAGIDNSEGLEVVKYVRDQSPSTPIIVLTAYGSPEVEAEVRRHGVKAFLRKPKPLADVAQIVFGLVGQGSVNNVSP